MGFAASGNIQGRWNGAYQGDGRGVETSTPQLSTVESSPVPALGISHVATRSGVPVIADKRMTFAVGCARYVGRVGALAVALGVGLAVASSPAVAWADSPAADSPSRSADSSHKPSGPEATSSSAKSVNAHRAKTGAADRPGSGSSSKAAVSSDISAKAGVNSPVGSPSRDTDNEPSDNSAASSDSATVAEVSAAAAPATKTAVSAPVAPHTGGVSRQATSVSSGDDDAVVGSLIASTEHAAPVVSAAEEPATLLGAVTHFLDSLLTPAPVSPTETPLIWTFLAAIRRDIVGAFYNQAPVVNPLEIGETAQGNVIGTVGAVDPDGDPMDYTVTQGPKFGTVVVNSDGTFNYTPGVDLAENGGEDTFTVEVRDEGFRLFSNPGVTSVPVTVTVGGGDSLGIGGMPYGVAMSTDGTRAYVTDIQNNRVSVVDIATRAVVGSIAVGKSPWGIAVGRDGRAYVVNSDDGTLSVIDTTTNTVLGDLIVGNSPTSVAVNADGSRVYVTNSNDNTVSVINTSTYASTLVEVGNSPFGVAVGGDKIYVANEYDDTVSVIDAATNTVIATIAVGDHPTGVAVGGNRVVVTNAGSSTVDDDGTVTLIDTTTLGVVGDPIRIGDSPTNVVVNADGTRAYVTDFGYGTVSQIDLQTGQLVGDPISVNNIAEGAAGVAIGSDGRLYVAGTEDGSIDPVSLDAPVVGNFQPVSAVGGAVSAAVQSAAIAAANAAAVGPNADVTTHTFKVYNLTSKPVTITKYLGEDRPLNGFPPAGTIIPPGGDVDVVVPEPNYFAQNNIQMVLTNKDGTTYTAYLRYDRTLFTSFLTTGQVSGAGAISPQAKFLGIRRYSIGDQVTLLEPPGTDSVIDSPTKDQTLLMNTLCTSGGVSCQFTATGSPVQTWTEYRPPQTASGVSSVLNNGSSVTQKRTIKYVVTESTKTTTEFSSKLNITFAKDLLGLELAAKYGTEVNASKTWEDSYELVAPPYKQVSLLVKAPIWQVTGNLVISFGNTTITMKNVTISNPDPTRSPVTDVRETDCTNCTIPPSTTGQVPAAPLPAPAPLVTEAQRTEELV
jgi:YVTN family beta-propeller protein